MVLKIKVVGEIIAFVVIEKYGWVFVAWWDLLLGG